MKVFVLVVFLLSTSFLAACTFMTGETGAPELMKGSGNVINENREVSGFNAITLQGMGKVVIDNTGSESLSITADDNFLPYIDTVVEGDTLYIRGAEHIVFTDVTDLTYHVTTANLDAIELQGAGSFNINNLDTDNWQVNLPGAGSITVAGRAAEQTVKMDGAGSYFAENLDSQKANIESNGAGTAVVRVSDQLDVVINGLGKVEYIGDPEVTKEINGVGTISKKS